MSEFKHTSVFPEYVLIRDTGLHDDASGLGQRIYTTAGAGYIKCKYVRHDLASAAPDLLEALRDALCALECCGKDYPAASKARAAIAKATGAGHE